MIEADLLVHSAGQLLTLAGGPQRGQDLGRLAMIEDGALAIHQGRITAVGKTGEIRGCVRAQHEIDADGSVVMPGFVDPHTHLLWAGDRAAEFEMRLAGKTYLEILAAGGGILSTVRATRAASVEELLAETRPRIRKMLAHGTTTAEAKTGYGLETGAELRMLDALLRLKTEGPLDIIPTFLGAHAVPPEYEGRSDAYTEYVCQEMLPAVRRWWLEHAGDLNLPFVDVFCERGAFNLEQSRRILHIARSLGFGLKIHADEFESLGGTRLAAELGATSADHLVHTRQADIEALGQATTAAVALPCTPFGLAESAYSPARALIEAGALLALASDLNPGTAWCESMQFVIALACRYLRLTPAQAIAAATINAAAAVGLADQVGSLEPGKRADVLILEVNNYRHLGYRFGTNLVSTVIRAGRVVVQ
ncbi:MAG: imidazolonepropionase [Chloroflexota bacterium]